MILVMFKPVQCSAVQCSGPGPIFFFKIRIRGSGFANSDPTFLINFEQQDWYAIFKVKI